MVDMEILSNHKIHVGLFVLWIVLLLPWVPFAPLSAMAFDAGPSFWVYLFVGSVLAYPVTVFIAFALYQKTPRIVFLPFLDLGVFFIASFLEPLLRKSN